MENKLKVGQTFEVVEVLTDGGFTDKSLFKIGGYCTAEINKYLGNDAFDVYPNGINENNYPYPLMMKRNEEIKPIGKLTITKVK